MKIDKSFDFFYILVAWDVSLNMKIHKSFDFYILVVRENILLIV